MDAEAAFSSGAATTLGGPADFSAREWLSLIQKVGGRTATIMMLSRHCKFSTTEKVVLEPEAIKATTPQEFVGLLRLVLQRSGMNAGQISVKTSISRSSAYNLVSATRTGLPTLPEQVLEFLCGCGLQMEQAADIMQLWSKLDEARRQGTPPQSSPSIAKPVTQLSPKEIAQEIISRGGPRLQDVPVRDLGRELLRWRTILPILAGMVVLLGWRFAATAQPSWGVLAAWPSLIGAELLIIVAMLRWWVRRTARIKAQREEQERVRREERQHVQQIEAERRRNKPKARDLADRLAAFYAA
ncbi:hypothetical protein AB0E55_22910 [Amycolatopsis keratiniphila]|uniref:hypothetical protein n=1 Tax=Amycolatopsis keratiniphila TaxID=129921 RepID=UPI0033F1DFEA